MQEDIERSPYQTRHTWHFPDGVATRCDYCDKQITTPELKKAMWYLHPDCAKVLAQGLMELILALNWTTDDFREVLGRDPMDLLMAVARQAIVHLKEHNDQQSLAT